MSMVAPKERQQLSADALFGWGRNSFANIPDHRSNDAGISFTDALMSAFAMLSLTSPSLLAFDQQRVAGNWATISGMQRAPCDPYRRATLDPVSPAALRPSCRRVFRPRQRGQALEARRFLDGHYGVALDGTGDFPSPTMQCASCRHKVHRHGSSTSDHQRLGAAMSYPDRRAVLPLRPEPIIQQEGTEKNAGERQAANRFMATLRQEHPSLTCIITDDSRRSTAPPIETLHDDGGPSLLGVKEGDPASLCTQGQAAEHAGRVMDAERADRETAVGQRFRFVHDLPLQAASAAVGGNVIEDGEIGPHQGQPCSWVTAWRVSKRQVYQLLHAGRARWKMAKETCNTLKNPGDNVEPNDGHGAQHRSVVFATLRMRAFVVDQTPQRCCAWCRAVWTTLGSKRRLWERLRALFDDDRLESRRALLEALFYGLEKPRPILLTDTSEIPRLSLTCRLVNLTIPNSHG